MLLSPRETRSPTLDWGAVNNYRPCRAGRSARTELHYLPAIRITMSTDSAFQKKSSRSWGDNRTGTSILRQQDTVVVVQKQGAEMATCYGFREARACSASAKHTS